MSERPGEARGSASPDPALGVVLVEARPLHGVRAGSALVPFGGKLLVVQDDALSAALVHPATGATEPLPLGPSTAHVGAIPKARKPDFEVAFTRPDGRVVVLGSGSASARCRLVELDPATGSVAEGDAGPLFESVARALGHRPNLEGAALVERGGERRLRLFHRGAAGQPSASLDVPLERLGAACAPENLVRWDLGRTGRVPFTFTDAAPSPDGRLFYLAAAEDTPNAIDDGPIVGAALGVFSRTGDPPAARFAPIAERDGSPCTRKLEGLAFVSPFLAYAVTDADDPERPAELCRLELRGPF